MPCRYPPPLTPDQISAAIDGQAEPSVYDHVTRCPDCAVRLEEARQFERALSVPLHRWDCPSVQAIADYHLGRLEPVAAAAVARHAEHCPLCAVELAGLRAYLAADARPAGVGVARPAARPLNRGRLTLGEIIARLLPGQPALALRGDVPGPVTAEAGEVLIVLDVQPAEHAQPALLGQIAAPNQDQWAGALVQLQQGGELLQTAFLDEAGGFRLEGVPIGLVDLRITPETGLSLVLLGLAIEL